MICPQAEPHIAEAALVAAIAAAEVTDEDKGLRVHQSDDDGATEEEEGEKKSAVAMSNSPSILLHFAKWSTAAEGASPSSVVSILSLHDNYQKTIGNWCTTQYLM